MVIILAVIRKGAIGNIVVLTTLTCPGSHHRCDRLALAVLVPPCDVGGQAVAGLTEHPSPYDATNVRGRHYTVDLPKPSRVQSKSPLEGIALERSLRPLGVMPVPGKPVLHG